MRSDELPLSNNLDKVSGFTKGLADGSGDLVHEVYLILKASVNLVPIESDKTAERPINETMFPSHFLGHGHLLTSQGRTIVGLVIH